MSGERDDEAINERNAARPDLESLDRWLHADGAVWRTRVASNEQLNTRARVLAATRINHSPEDTVPVVQRETTATRTSIGRQVPGRMLKVGSLIAAAVVVALMATLLNSLAPSRGHSSRGHFGTGRSTVTTTNASTVTAGTAIPQGTLVWSQPTDQLLFGAPAVANGAIYLGASDGNMYAYDARTGTSRWVEQASAILQSPSIATGGLVYITGIDGQITAYRASNGGVVWSRRLTQNGFSSPTVVGNVVYAGASDHYLYTLDASTGVTLSRWKAGGPLIFTPVVVDGVAYFTSHDSSPNPNGYFAYALRLADGVTLWHVPVSGNALAVGNGIVYVGGNAPAITALNANTGATLWRDPLPPGGVIGVTAPVVAGNLVYVGGDGVYALDTVSGKQRWTYPAGQVFAAPVVANGVLYVGSADGAVLSLNAVTGSPRWTFATGGQIESSLAVAGGVVYVGANGAGVYALNA